MCIALATGCTAWSQLQTCPDWMVCSGGSCVSHCLNQANDEDEIILKDGKGKVVDAVGYKDWTITAGASLKDMTLDNNDPNSYCTEKGAWSGSKGDKGTPGHEAACK